ncbi:MAG: YggS family pyridoxal phosphate-dependent enzyme [Hyphomicrobiaceae bacterium]|nr:YggS family pyridoxal phosphate-dependent enzyme [Hyphomicrobiaceae bacterium]
MSSNLAIVKKQMRAACKEAGRNPDEIDLIAVSKMFAVEQILPVLQAGQKRFGENRVQEAQRKWPQLREQYDNIELHLIGPLQSNKTKEAVELFDVIHTVDREKIARALKKEMDSQGREVELLIQVNTGEEPQKAGIAPLQLADFVSFCRDELQLKIAGLMCIPPVDEEPALHFALLKKYADELGLEKLSMGMSADFETAVALGATYVRVGSAIFGARDYR